jgi:hypothetical protein
MVIAQNVLQFLNQHDATNVVKSRMVILTQKLIYRVQVILYRQAFYLSYACKRLLGVTPPPVATNIRL